MTAPLTAVVLALACTPSPCSPTHPPRPPVTGLLVFIVANSQDIYERAGSSRPGGLLDPAHGSCAWALLGRLPQFPCGNWEQAGLLRWPSASWLSPWVSRRRSLKPGSEASQTASNVDKVPAAASTAAHRTPHHNRQHRCPWQPNTPSQEASLRSPGGRLARPVGRAWPAGSTATWRHTESCLHPAAVVGSRKDAQCAAPRTATLAN